MGISGGDHPQMLRQYYMGHGKGNEDTTTTTSTTTAATTTVATTPAAAQSESAHAAPIGDSDSVVRPGSSSSSGHQAVQDAPPASSQSEDGGSHQQQQPSSPVDSPHVEADHAVDESQASHESETKTVSHASDRPPSFPASQPAAPAVPAQGMVPQSGPVKGASTTYSLFNSDLQRFNMDHIHTTKHYLTDKLQGRIWLDANGDGRRGDKADAEINSEEYNTGIGGVQVQLVDCKTDEIVMDSVTSEPVSLYGGNPVVKRTDDPSAGLYDVPFNNVEAGRYYLMYTAPRDYRLSGNVLPLDRNFPYFDCVPRGGEGDIYIKEALERGDLDITGYCARSIGCFEVDNNINPHEKSNFDNYSQIEFLNDGEDLEDGINRGYAMFMGNLAALPSADYFEVGLAREMWELPTYQYADAQITLTFPEGRNDLEEALPGDFERSAVRRDLEAGISEFLGKEQRESFDVQGIDMHGGVMGHSLEHVHRKSNMNSDEEGSRMLRGTARRYVLELQEPKPNQITYTVTARGAYRPPPFRQLGAALEHSINADPKGVAKSLKEKADLPPVIAEVQDVKAKWLTVKEMPPPPAPVVIKTVRFMDTWVFYLICGVGGLVILVCSVLLFRRWEHRRRRVSMSEATEEIKQMTDFEIKRELRSYGICTTKFVDTKELVDALVSARKNGSKLPQKKVTFSITSMMNSFSSQSTDDYPSGACAAASSWKKASEECRKEVDRLEMIEEATESCKTLRVSELKEMLKALGVSSKGFTEKGELVRALAEARVDGAAGEGRPAAPSADSSAKKQTKSRSRSHSRSQSPKTRPGAAPVPGVHSSSEKPRTRSRERQSSTRGSGVGTSGVHGHSPSPGVTASPATGSQGYHGSGHRRPSRSHSPKYKQPNSSAPANAQRRHSGNAVPCINDFSNIAGPQLEPPHSSSPLKQSHSSSPTKRRHSNSGLNAGAVPGVVPGPSDYSNPGPSPGRSHSPMYHPSSCPRSSSRPRDSSNRPGRSHSPRYQHSKSRSPSSSRRSAARSRSPSCSFARAWSTGIDYSKFDPSGYARPCADYSGSSRRSRSQDSVRFRQASAEPRSRSVDVSQRSRSRSRSASRRRSARKTVERKAPPAEKIDDMFNDGFSFDVTSSAAPDPPETERPPANRDSVRADLMAAQPWVS